MSWLYALLIIVVILVVTLTVGNRIIDYIERLFNEIKRTDNDEDQYHNSRWQSHLD